MRLWSCMQRTVDDFVWCIWVRTDENALFCSKIYFSSTCVYFSQIASYIAVYCSTAVFIFMSMSLVPFVFDVMWPLNESRPILPPYPGYYFVDIREYFFKIFWHSIIAWEIIMAGIVAHDCMFVTYVEHVCSMFAMVG